MNRLVLKFYTENKESNFEDVIFVDANFDLQEILKKAPKTPKAWLELMKIGPADRRDFTRDFWLDQIPYHPVSHPAFFEFFSKVDDISLVLTKQTHSANYIPELVYSLKDDSCFFRGLMPAEDEVIDQAISAFEISLPQDFLSFLKIHNGFGKLSEMGLLKIEEMEGARSRVFKMLMESERKVRSGVNIVDPGALFPFFEVLGLSSFQCFYSDWYPGNEMGNVYLSGIDYTVSDTTDKRFWQENLAFSNFSQWLSFYLQGMNLCT